MLYLAATGSSLQHQHSNLGVIVGPRVGGIKPIHEGRRWVGDNDSYTGFNAERFLKMLHKMQPHAKTCLFVVAPDVVADAQATLDQYLEWAPVVRAHGFRVAWVAQNGAEDLETPPCDAVFIGGSTAWKLSTHAEKIMREANILRRWVHVGRVNSYRRCLWACGRGADSVDGTYLSFAGTGRGLRNLNTWLNKLEHHQQGQLIF